MAETNLGIELYVIDNATAQIKKNMSEVQTATKGVETATRTTGTTIQQQFKEAGKTLKDFRRTLFVVTAAFATMVLATKEAAKYNKEAADSFLEFTYNVQTLSTTLGQIFAPAIEFVGRAIGVLRDIVEGAVAGFIKLFSFVASFFENISSGPIEAYKRAMVVSNLATDEFLKKIEETKAKVSSGWTLQNIQDQMVLLGKLAIRTRDIMIDAWSAVGDSLGNLGSQLAAASEMGRSFAQIAAGIAIATAVINTAVGFTRALADYPWPFSMVVAGLVAAAGAVQIATIAATKFHEGGPIRAHNGLAVDEVPIIAQTGEGILSRKGMAALGGVGNLNALNSGRSSGGGIVVNMNNVSFRSEDDIEDVMTRLSNLIVARTRSRV